MRLRSVTRLGWNPSTQTEMTGPYSGDHLSSLTAFLRPPKGFHCLGDSPNGGFSLRRTPGDTKRAHLSRRGVRKQRAYTDNPAQLVLGTGTSANRSSTYEAGSARHSGPGRRRAPENTILPREGQVLDCPMGERHD